MLMRSVLLLACLLGLVVPAASQTPLVVRVVTTCGTVPTTYIAGSNNPAVQDINGNFCTSASVSASISGFAPATTGTPISVTASAGGVTGTLPAGAVVVASNVGTTNIAYCKLGATSTTSDQPIAPNGGWFAFTVGAATQLTCITSTSTTTVNMVGGSGLPTGTGGGGGGSGGAITMASGAVSSGAYSSGSISAGAQVDLLTMRGTKAPGTAAANSALVGGVYTSGGVTLTDGQQAAWQLTSAGSGHVTVDNSTTAVATNAAIAATSSAVASPVWGYNSVFDGTNWQPMAGTSAGVTVRQPTAANFNATVVGTGTFVTQSALTATEVHAGEIGSNQIRVDVAQTVTASSAYTAGNAVGGLMTISGASRVSGSLGAAGTGGIVQQVVMNSKSVQTAQIDVFLFNSNPSGSTCTDKTAFVLATADFDKVIGVASIPGTTANNSGWFSGGTGSVGQANNLAMAFDLASATTIYACAVTRGTPTFTATSDISLKYQILRN
jgi:hypothetical protein